MRRFLLAVVVTVVSALGASAQPNGNPIQDGPAIYLTGITYTAPSGSVSRIFENTVASFDTWLCPGDVEPHTWTIYGRLYIPPATEFNPIAVRVRQAWQSGFEYHYVNQGAMSPVPDCPGWWDFYVTDEAFGRVVEASGVMGYLGYPAAESALYSVTYLIW